MPEIEAQQVTVEMELRCRILGFLGFRDFLAPIPLWQDGDHYLLPTGRDQKTDSSSDILQFPEY